jgi:hypothetical protein
VNPRQQGPHTERRILRAQRRRKGHHRVVELVGAVRPAFPRDQAGDPAVVPTKNSIIGKERARSSRIACRGPSPSIQSRDNTGRVGSA